MNETKSLKYRCSKTIRYDGVNCIISVKVRLDDECKNGHQDFSITGDISTTKGRFITGGCIHEEIQKYFPNLKQFIDLHLCDYKGVPTFAAENGRYHIHGKMTKERFCEYYRVLPREYDALRLAENAIEYSISLHDLGILKRWEVEAKAAIKELEELTGEVFLIDSKRTNLKQW